MKEFIQRQFHLAFREERLDDPNLTEEERMNFEAHLARVERRLAEGVQAPAPSPCRKPPRPRKLERADFDPSLNRGRA